MVTSFSLLGNPWPGLWEQLASAAWVANVFIPLLITLSAIGLSFWGLRYQLAHDRILINEERNRLAAIEVGRAIDQFLEVWDGIRPTEPLPRRVRIAVFNPIKKASREAELILGRTEALFLAVKLSDDMLRRWDVVLKLAARKKADMSTIDSILIRGIFGAPRALLYQLGSSLRAWDGFGDVPSLTDLDNWEPFQDNLVLGTSDGWEAKIIRRYEEQINDAQEQQAKTEEICAAYEKFIALRHKAPG